MKQDATRKAAIKTMLMTGMSKEDAEFFYAKAADDLRNMLANMTETRERLN